MTPTYLDDIVAFHRERASRDDREWRERVETTRVTGPSLFEALSDRTEAHVKVIAEVKRRSPSKGWIDEHLDPALLATEYHEGGASAISVLTDDPHFAGSVADLEAVRTATSLPILRKDFTVSANDVIDAAAMGASAVLLIVAALSDEEVTLFLDVAARCGLDALVEVHDHDEAGRAIDLGAFIVGVNQRDLRTFEVSPDRAQAVIAALPTHVVTVAESGFTTVQDVRRAADAGFDAVLVGETFVRSSRPSAAVRSFAGVMRRPRD
ncbi:MAG: indole-3-glycerol phosphate synthase TrpC [Acidimicrobiales bacterium]